MGESWHVNRQITALEYMADIDVNQNSLQVISAIRGTLTRCGMSESYRDQFLTRMVINLPLDLSEEQSRRIVNASCKLIKKLYMSFHDLGFNDQAIALLGSQVEIILGDN